MRYLKDHADDGYADVDTRIIDQKGQEFSVNYRLYRINGDWKVYDVVIENVSLVNNYRTQFNRVLTKSSYAELVKRLRAKKLSASGPSGSAFRREVSDVFRSLSTAI